MRTVIAICVSSLGLLGVLAAGRAAAAAAAVELLGQPCRAFNVLAGRVVVDADGNERLVLSNMNEHSGAELIFIDLRDNTGVTHRAPAGAGAWALKQVPGDRLVMGTFYDGVFLVFDLKSKRFIKVADFPGETYIWDVAIGSDGRVYGGTYPGGKLGALDLETYAIEDLGAAAPPNLYLRNVSATPDGRILCAFIATARKTLLFDPRTKSFAPVPPSLSGVETGVSWDGHFLSGARVFKGEQFERVDPPFPTPPAEKGSWSVDAYATNDDVLVLRQGNRVYTYRKDADRLTLVADVEVPGRTLGVTRDGAVVGVRGQDYIVLAAGATDVKLIPIPAEKGPRATHFIKADDRGRLWGGPTFGQTLFWMDVATKAYTNTSTICNSGGEVYDVAFLDGKVYAASYVGGDVVRFDPDEPWDQRNNVNPKTIAHLAPRGYIRPVAGIVLGPDRMLYSGWMAKYGTYGGAIAITDPRSGDTELIENPLGEAAVSAIAVDQNSIFVGTTVGANGLPDKAGAFAKFGVIDRKARAVTFTHTFDGAGHVAGMLYDRRTSRVAMVVKRRLHVFDPAKQAFVELPADLGDVTSHTISGTGDGSIYYGSGKNVVSFDLASGQVNTIAQAPATVEKLTMTRPGEIFVASGADVYRITY